MFISFLLDKIQNPCNDHSNIICPEFNIQRRKPRIMPCALNNGKNQGDDCSPDQFFKLFTYNFTLLSNSGCDYQILFLLYRRKPCATSIFAKRNKVDSFRYSRIKTINLIWWSRGESNPCPKATWKELLRVQFVIYIPSSRREQTPCGTQ